jgi:Family of unknown function (DUF6455)
MNLLFTLIPLSVLVLTLVLFLVLLAVAIVFNFRSGMKYRTALAERLDSLRLGRMLAALGIDIDSYLSSERVVDIHQHMQRCSDCSNIGPCDAGLVDGSINPDSIGFCNNEQSLRELVQRKSGEKIPDVY